MDTDFAVSPKEVYSTVQNLPSELSTGNRNHSSTYWPELQFCLYRSSCKRAPARRKTQKMSATIATVSPDASRSHCTMMTAPETPIVMAARSLDTVRGKE